MTWRSNFVNLNSFKQSRSERFSQLFSNEQREIVFGDDVGWLPLEWLGHSFDVDEFEQVYFMSFNCFYLLQYVILMCYSHKACVIKLSLQRHSAVTFLFTVLNAEVWVTSPQRSTYIVKRACWWGGCTEGSTKCLKIVGGVSRKGRAVGGSGKYVRLQQICIRSMVEEFGRKGGDR